MRVEGGWEEETLIFFPFQGKENVFVIMGLRKRIAACKYFAAVYQQGYKVPNSQLRLILIVLLNELWFCLKVLFLDQSI